MKTSLIIGVGVSMVIASSFLESGFLLGIGITFIMWGIIEDVLNGVTWQKKTVIHTKYVYIDKTKDDGMEG